MTPNFDIETLYKGSKVCGMERLFDVPSKAFEKLTQLCLHFRRKYNADKQTRPENITPEKFLELSEQVYDA